jgi:hypothetical protein
MQAQSIRVYVPIKIIDQIPAESLDLLHEDEGFDFDLTKLVIDGVDHYSVITDPDTIESLANRELPRPELFKVLEDQFTKGEYEYYA